MKSTAAPALVKPLSRGEAPATKHHTKVSRFFRKLTDAQVTSFVATVAKVLQETPDLDVHRVRMACMLWVEAQP